MQAPGLHETLKNDFVFLNSVRTPRVHQTEISIRPLRRNHIYHSIESLILAQDERWRRG